MSRKADRVDAFQYLVWRSIGIMVVIEVLSLWQSRRARSGYRPRTLVAWTGGRGMLGANFGLFLASLAFVYAVKTTTPANAAFLGALTPEQKTKATFDFAGEERTNWHFIPRERKGLQIKEMTQEQRLLAHARAQLVLPRGGVAVEVPDQRNAREVVAPAVRPGM
mgnify:CR=1 FL=1